MNFKKFQIVICIIALFNPISLVLAVSDAIDVIQQVIKGIPCNYNGICEPQWGETAEFCSDCGGAVYISPSLPIVVAESIPEHPEIPKSLIINNNAVYTTSLDVTLSLSAENVFQMAISNSPDFAGISWEPYQTTKKWTLTKGDGKKTVYAKFRSPDGGVSQVISDTIILDTTPPTNVFNFEAIAGDSQITLSWQNPPDPDFKAVKIMRSEKFYPSDPSDGISVYDGKGTSFLDKGLKNGVRYYYTAFTYDKIGNYSSGAITSAVPQKPLPPEEIPPEILPPPEEIPPVIPPPPEIEKLTLKDFDFWQEDKKIPLEEGIKIKTETEKPLTISIPYESVPEVLKTIMVTLEKEGKFFSFLLRVNKEKTAYLSTLVPPEEAKVYPLTFTILDYKNQTLKKISGQLEVKKTEARPLSVPWYMKIINSVLNWLQSIWQAIKNIFTF
ncbi:MAG: hypothetical protein COX90_00600 [Candidatus Nealsonbacteria bacterium CG_4_10_14_0_2_um_filter_38_17]|uniref:Fibronectin type-III domain-containing protein n=1 Tax=Candidatus Nealsonbacteria bacterium CG_4_10_14_0_2_um_filter_38_17 TaxID=1974680 RepID=A0A2M7UZ03_9BACT|nr:MAG: hypothetical protein COX90_00600 [Candidatus Nealsonbacteria bacterium CG_4_10_14_0_2_um_filter_38_17]